MSRTQATPNSVRTRRLARGWSQQELADRAALSRAGISAVESGRLAPSVTAALALAKALGCTVEELFLPSSREDAASDWAIEPARPRVRFWQARVADRVWKYPVEDDSPQLDWHDGVAGAREPRPSDPDLANRTLVVAGCDPAAGLLAAEYARQFQFRMIVLRRSSREALKLLAAGKVHAAGLHLGDAQHRSGNRSAARAQVGSGCVLVRVARWEEGLALGPRLKAAATAALGSAKTRWVGREEGSGARQCQDEILAGRPAPRRVAFDHRSVASAVKCGWADVGPCVRLASEESGLGFLKITEKDYDLCFLPDSQSDPRITALVATLASRRYRARLAELPGYSTRHTGELVE
jgi:molybdate-binding protein/transcriptional regulator with XRE-family HTH domain